MVRGYSLLVGPDSVDTVSEFLGLSVVGELALHPDGIGVGSIGNSTVDGAVAAALQSVVTLTGSGSIPVEEDILAQDGLGDLASLGVALTLDLGEVLLLSSVLVADGRGINGGGNGFVESLEAGIGQPIILDLLELGTVLASSFGSDHKIVEGLKVGVGGANDEGMVAGIDGGGDEGGSLGIGTGNGKEVGACGSSHVNCGSTCIPLRKQLTHDISLGTDGNQTVNVLADWNENLSGHMTTLLGTRSLVLNVNTSSTLLNEELGELHDGGKTTVTSVGIGNNRSQVIEVVETGTLRLGDGETLLSLLAVVEELGHEKVADLVRDGGLGIVLGWCSQFVDKMLNLRRGSQPDQDRARQKQRQWKMIAIQRRRQCRGTLPSE